MNRIDWVFGLLWWLVNTIAIFVGGFVALYVGFLVGGVVGRAIEGTNEGIAGYIAFWTIAPLILSATVGAAQGWLLRERLPIAQWFGATLGGGAIAAAMIVGMGFYDRSVGASISPMAVWVGTAITQWWLLKSFSARAIVWLIAGVVGISIALSHLSVAVSPGPVAILLYSVVTAILIVLILQTPRSGDRSSLK